MNRKQALYLGGISAVLLTLYTIGLYYYAVIPFGEACLITIVAVILVIGILGLIVGAVKLYDKLEDK